MDIDEVKSYSQNIREGKLVTKKDSSQKGRFNKGYVIFAVIMGICIIAAILVILVLYPMTLSNAILMIALFIAFYSLFLFFLIEPQLLRRSSELPPTLPPQKEIVREIIHDRPVVVHDRPIVHEIRRTFLSSPRSTLTIPRHEYFASTETKVVHHQSCRFRKLIKRKFQKSGDTLAPFLKQGYARCPMCLPLDAPAPKKTSQRPKKSSRKKSSRNSSLSIHNRAEALRRRKR